MRSSTPTTVALLALLGASAAGAQARFLGGPWQLTQYWVADERSHTTGRAAVPVRHRDGRVLHWACPTFAAALAMEGTGRTWDRRLLNWDTRLAGQACFAEVDDDDYPWGVGVQGFALVPYRSLAVDRRHIDLGHVVELPELAGLLLPTGSTHDGCFVAADGGGAIQGHHLDLFVPGEDSWRALSRSGRLPARLTHIIVDSPRCAWASRFARVPGPEDPTRPR